MTSLSDATIGKLARVFKSDSSQMNPSQFIAIADVRRWFINSFLPEADRYRLGAMFNGLADVPENTLYNGMPKIPKPGAIFDKDGLVDTPASNQFITSIYSACVVANSLKAVKYYDPATRTGFTSSTDMRPTFNTKMRPGEKDAVVTGQVTLKANEGYDYDRTLGAGKTAGD